MMQERARQTTIRSVETIKLAVTIKGKQVLLDSNEQIEGTLGMVAKSETEKALAKLSSMLEQASEPQERIERILRKLVESPQANLALTELLAEITYEHARALRNPMLWIGIVYDHVFELIRNRNNTGIRWGLEVMAMHAMILFNTAERVERGETNETEFRKLLSPSS